MKKLIQVDSNNKVISIHYKPTDPVDGIKINGKIATEEELVQLGILVQDIPSKLPDLEGKVQELYYVNSILEWKYEDIPKSQEQIQIEVLQQQVEQQNKAISDLTMMIAMSQTPTM